MLKFSQTVTSLLRRTCHVFSNEDCRKTLNDPTKVEIGGYPRRPPLRDRGSNANYGGRFFGRFDLFLHFVAFVLSPDVDVVLASFRDPLHEPAPWRDALDRPAVFLCIRVLRCGLRSSHGPQSLS